MSQSGKVLHLYVEVRSAPDQKGGKGDFGENEEGNTRPVEDSPAELLSHLASQTASKASPAQRRVQDSTHSPSPSRNTVSFQLQQTSSSPTVSKRWSAPCDTPPNLRRFNKEEATHGKRSVVTFSYIEKSNVKTLDSPRNRGTREERSTPSHIRKRLSDPVWLGSPDSSCSSSPKLTFRSPGSHQQTFSPGLRQPALDPIGRAATQRAVEEFGSPLLRIKLAHALEHTSSSRYNQQPRCQSWAGSPVQRQNISLNPKDYISDRAQAVSSLPRSPASDHLSSQSGQRCAETPKEALHWSGDKGVAGSPATRRHVHRTRNRSTSPQGAIFQLGNNITEGLNQLSDSKSSSPAQSPEVARRLAEEATKVSSILTEARRSSLHNAFGESGGAPNPAEFPSSPSNAQQSKQPLKMNIPLNEQLTPAADNTDCHQLENSSLQSQSLETNSHNNYETQPEEKPQHRSSILPVGESSPAIPSRVLRPSHPPTEFSSPIRDPRIFQAELRAPDTPTLHRRQLPQYTRESWSPGPDKRGDVGGLERGDCTELARRLFINQSVEETPVSWTSRQQWGDQLESSPRPHQESGSVNDQTANHQPGRRRRPLSPTAQQKRAEQRRREILLLGPVALDSPEEDEGCDEEEQGDEMDGLEAGQQPHLQRVEEPAEAEQNGAMAGSSSRSSSGVTGSLGDRDCVSPESSQSSHQSNETGAATSGIQVDFLLYIR